MAIRVQRVVRRSGRAAAAAAAVLAAGVTLAVSAPASQASAARVTTGPSGVQARAAAIANAATGHVLWSRGLNTELPMASLTKVMTALVVIRTGDLSRRITVPAAAVSYVEEHDASNAGLRPGDTLTTGQLLAALLLPSGADAAYTLAEAYGPGLDAFIARMNATANRLGMTRTHFSNFDGLPYPTGYSTYSTPADLIRLGRAAMTSADFRWIVGQRSYRIASGSGHHAYFWPNLNPLLGVYQGAIGIKTGWTPTAGHCLLFEAIRGRHSLIGVDLDGPGTGTMVSGSDATQMLNWAFSQEVQNH